MRYVMAGVLAVAAAGMWEAGGPPAPSGVADMEDAMARALEPPKCQFVSNKFGATTLYERVDCLGGLQEASVYSWQGTVTGCSYRYRPFAVRPPWLGALRDAFGPRPVP